MMMNRISTGKVFTVPYKKYSNTTYALEQMYEHYKIITVYEDDSILAVDTKRKRDPKVFSKQDIERFLEKEILMRL